jgi:hypothetical protein
VIKNGFWPGVHFSDIDHLNGQAKLWCDRLNQKVHRTTRQVPMDRWVEENLTPLPNEFAWERFGAEERKVSWDGFISYDGVYYGLPADPPVAGAVVLVRERKLELRIYHQGKTDYDAYEASSLPRHCRASRPIQGGRTSCTAQPHGSPTGTSSQRSRRLRAQPG